MNIAFLQFKQNNPTEQFNYLQEIQKKVTHHNDYILNNIVLADRFVSFNEVISYCQEKTKATNIESLYIYNRDEINEDIQNLYQFALLCKENNIKLYCVAEKRELSEQIIKDFNAGKNEWIKQRSADSFDQMKQQASEGKWMASAPLGYILKGKTLEIDENKIEAIKEIFLHYSRGLSAETCTRFLYEVHNIGTAIGHKSERAMSTPKFYEILTQPLYNGYPAWNRSTFNLVNGKKKREFLPRKDWIIAENQLNHLVIVPNVIWEKVVTRLKDEGKYELCNDNLLEEENAS